MGNSALKALLDESVERHNRPDFIEHDPISIPHRFSQLQDIEIMGFWVAMLAWGQRVTIINKANQLIQLMDGAPYQFITQHEEKDRTRFLDFKHRTFNATDTLYFLEVLQRYYKEQQSLETAFAKYLTPEADNTEAALIGFHEQFFALPFAPQRTRKHIATPARKSTCKRLNMFLRWMVRSDDKGVDFGLWQRIQPAQLLMPLDVHV
ncbi:MAG: TIGR02757 family protein, partial [Bacteroidota bacterium]